MTTQTWIEFGGGFIVLLIALIPSFKIRAMHRAMQSQLTRQLRTRMLIVYVSHIVIWTIVGVSFMSGVVSFFYFAAIAVIYIPTIIWIIKSPADDHVA
jgi:hypothetical protein